MKTVLSSICLLLASGAHAVEALPAFTPISFAELHQTKTSIKTPRAKAGDVLSEGVPNPAKLALHKGIGEGRRYFVQQYKKILKDKAKK